MELIHDFRVPVPPDQAWDVLTDVERIAPCMPGAQLQEIEGEEYRGVVKVKVGPITAQYKGKATFAHHDQAGGRVVLRCEGRDTRGQGNANATITVTMEGDEDGTDVHVATDLTVTGKVAQFGRGVMADVSAKLLDQFVSCLQEKLLSEEASAGGAEPAGGSTEAAAPASAPLSGGGAGSVTPAATGVVAPPAEEPNGQVGAPGPSVRTVDQPEATPVNLFDAAGSSIAKRVVPAVVAVIGISLLVSWLLRRARAGR